jgi:phosphomannomutase/phosphoglucomutase
MFSAANVCTAEEGEHEAQAKALAATISGNLAPYRAALVTLAVNPDIVAGVKNPDAATRDALAVQHVPTLQGVVRLRLLPAQWRDPDPTARPPLTFASISMLAKARETGKDVPIEAHLANTADEHLVVVQRVEESTGDGQTALAGFLHLAVNLAVLRQAVTADLPADVYVEIRQVPGGALVTSGIKPGEDAAASTNARIDDTRFIVSYSSAGETDEADSRESGHLTMWPAIAAVLLAVVAIAFVLARRGQGVRIGVPDVEAVTYQGAIKAILDGAHPGLEQLMPGARKSGAPLNLDATAGARADGDDVTVMKGTRPRPPVSEDPTVPKPDTPRSPPAVAPSIAPSIFRTYDIRGIVGDTLTEESVYQIGRALGAEAEQRRQKTVVVARDGRHSSEALLEALTKGLLESGRDVLDIGLVPTPVLYFATHYLDAHSGVMITGSHNPAEYNGLKIVLDGETLSGDAIQAVRRRVEQQDFVEGTGSLQAADIVAEYIRRITEEIPVSLGNALKVVVDCGNGVPGMVAPAILRAIGHDVIELFCEVDGDFPNHHPDPSQPENLTALIAAVADEGADLGLAFDGDGDRLGVVDAEGNVIWPDRQMILFARDILSRNPGAKIIFDVKCSRLLAREIEAAGGEPIMSKTGHSLIKSRMQETGALLAGEMSGHIFFKERWYGFDDALYSAARLLEILVGSGKAPAEVFAELPGGVATPELRLDMPEERHAEFMDKVLAAANFDYAELSTIDGLRVDFVDSWGLIRPSNTTPCLVIRFEGDDADALEEIKERFRKLLLGIDAKLKLPF